MHEDIAVDVDELSSERAHLLGNERAENLLGVARTRGVVLESVRVEEARAYSVAEDKTVSRSAVVVGGREALIVQTTRTAGRDDDSLSACHEELLSLHIHEDSTSRPAVFVEDNLDRRREVDNGDTAVDDLVAESTHYLSARVVLRRVHTLAGGTAAVSCYHSAVGFLVELNAELVEPLNSLGSLCYELSDELGLSREVTAAESVEEVDSGRIVGLVSGLDSALSHHSVSVADTELGDYHSLHARLISLYSRGSTCSAAADDEHIGVVVGRSEVNVSRADTALSLQELSELSRHLIALVDARREHSELLLLVVGVEMLVLFLGSHTSGLELCICRSLFGNDLSELVELIYLIHCAPSLLLDIAVVVHILELVDVSDSLGHELRHLVVEDTLIDLIHAVLTFGSDVLAVETSREHSHLRV